jgi:hypothetical protein
VTVNRGLRLWEKDALGHPCPFCHAVPGAWCRSKNGRIATALHDDRYERADRDRLAPLFDPGAEFALATLPLPGGLREPPVHRDGPATEKTATTASRTGRLRVLALRALAAHPEGLTNEELAAETGIYLYSIAPRVPELRRDGYVEDTGRRRTSGRGRPVIVWAATDAGRSWVAGVGCP